MCINNIRYEWVENQDYCLFGQCHFPTFNNPRKFKKKAFEQNLTNLNKKMEYEKTKKERLSFQS